MTVRFCGAVAQLGERDTGSVEVRGSSPLSSTSPVQADKQKNQQREAEKGSSRAAESESRRS